MILVRAQKKGESSRESSKRECVYHGQNVARHMNAKGRSDEVSDRDEEHGI